MDPLTMYGIGQGVSSILGGLFGGGGDAPQLPPEIMQLLMTAYETENITGFMPDKQAFDQSMRAQIDEVMATLPVSMEEFNAGVASRGLFGAGEAPKRMYADVVAPVGRAATSAVATANLGYAKASQYGKIEAARLKMQQMQQILQAAGINLGSEMTDFQMDIEGRGAVFGGLGNAATLYGLSKWG